MGQLIINFKKEAQETADKDIAHHSYELRKSDSALSDPSDAADGMQVFLQVSYEETLPKAIVCCGS